MNMTSFPVSDLKKILFFLCLLASHWLLGQSDPIINPSNCGLGLTIPDSTCNTTNVFRIDVAGESGTQLGTDVFLEEIRLIIAHSWIADLDISLTSPNGVKVEISTDNGEDEDNYGDPSDVSCGSYISFSSSSCNSIIEIVLPPFVGTYQPEGNLLDFNDDSNPNGQWLLEICDDAGDDAGTLEFVELVFSPIICLAPSEVEVVSLDSTTVKLDWFSSANCEEAIIEYGLPGFTPGTDEIAGNGTLVSANCPPFTLQGLQPYTTYEVYIREECSEDNFSANSCPITITTSCLPPPISLVETFDDQEVCSNFCGRDCDIQGVWKNDRSDSFDWTIYSDPSPSAGTGPSGDVENDGNYIYLETSGSQCRDGNLAYLVSNCLEVDTENTDSCHFSFNYHLFGASIASLSLEISTDGGGNWTSIWSETGNQGDRWFKQYLSLTPWNGQVVRFRFVGEGGSGATGDIALDNLVFYGTRDLGEPSNIFYADVDEDSYGDANNFITSCSSILPTGFVTNALDCNDDDENINPDAEEIACNGIDENCNGEEDDFVIDPPMTISASICSGEMGTVFAEAPENGFILWYGSPDEEDFLYLDNGEGYSELLETNGDTLTKTFYAEAFQGFECRSGVRAPATITVLPQPKIAIVPPASICAGESVNLGDITVVDENNLNGDLTYHSAFPPKIENQLSDLVVNPISNTIYYISSTTDLGCTDVEGVEIQISSDVEVSINRPDTISICVGSFTDLEVVAADMNIAYTYIWDNGEIGESIEIQASSEAEKIDQYILSIIPPDGCIAFDTVWVRASAGIESARVIPQDVNTCGGSDGSLFVEPLNGTPPYSYSWSGTSSGEAMGVDGAFTIENLAQGTYRVTIVDNSSLDCNIQLPFTTINGPSANVSLTSVTPTSCNGTDDVEICINVQGLNPQIEWSTGDTTVCISGLANGLYDVTVTDGDCETVLTAIAVESPDIIETAASLSMPTCAENSDGIIDLTTSGGTAPYRYNWQDLNLNEKTRNNLAAGDYVVSILDANDCTFNDTISLTAPDTLKITGAIVQNTSCFELENGVIMPEVIGGTAPYFYEWNTGAFGEVLSDLSNGDYEVTVTDVNGCQVTERFEVMRPATLSLSLDSIQNASCEGAENGLLRVVVTGGSFNYTYQWSNERAGNQIENIGTGKYELTVTDENGCSLVDSFFITAPPSIQLSSDLTNPKCIGGRDGAIDLTISNATVDKIEWNDGRIVEDLDRIMDGTYYVTVTDVNGCTLQDSFILTAPQLLEVSVTTRAPSCTGSRDGSIQLDVVNQNGLPPDFRWNTGPNTQDLMNIGAGEYTAIVKDRDGCTFETDTIFLKNPEPIIITADKIVSTQCSGQESGSVEITVMGGFPPYEYDWGIASTEDLYDVSAGNYRVAVLDGNGCAAQSEIFQVESPPAIEIDYRIVQNELCQLESGGVDSLILNVSGGRPGYDYQWSNGATTRNLTNIEAGDYSITVEDRNQCQAIISSIKVKPPSNGFSVITRKQNVQCNGDQDGSILASVRGGTAPFIYHLSNGDLRTINSDSIFFSQLKASNYDLTITDANGCQTIAENIFLTEPESIIVNLGEDGIQNVQCKGDTIGGIDLEVSGGFKPYTFSWKDQMSNEISDSLDLKNVLAGIYTFSVTDVNGCSTEPKIYTLREPNFPIEFQNIDVTSVQCKGENSGAIKIRVTGGKSPYQYNWNDGQFMDAKNLTGIFAGEYQLRVIDDNDCIAFSDTIIVSEAERPIRLAEREIFNTSCHDTEDGYIRVEIDGGIAPYQFFWESTDQGNNYVNGGTSVVDDLPSGNYTLSIIDSFACPATFDFFVDSPEPLLAEPSSSAAQKNKSNGSASVDVAGGIEPYSYAWSTDSNLNLPTLPNVPAGVYFVTITDASDCELVVGIEVKEDLMDATNDLEVGAKIELFPNPVNDWLQLNLEFTQAEDIYLQVYSSKGIRLLEQEQNNLLTKGISVDVSDFPAGVYLLRIMTTDGRSASRLFVKSGE